MSARVVSAAMAAALRWASVSSRAASLVSTDSMAARMSALEGAAALGGTCGHGTTRSTWQPPYLALGGAFLRQARPKRNPLAFRLVALVVALHLDVHVQPLQQSAAIQQHAARRRCSRRVVQQPRRRGERGVPRQGARPGRGQRVAARRIHRVCRRVGARPCWLSGPRCDGRQAWPSLAGSRGRRRQGAGVWKHGRRSVHAPAAAWGGGVERLVRGGGRPLHALTVDRAAGGGKRPPKGTPKGARGIRGMGRRCRRQLPGLQVVVVGGGAVRSPAAGGVPLAPVAVVPASPVPPVTAALRARCVGEQCTVRLRTMGGLSNGSR